ncbi:MAG: DUF86 domain-containing protein [Blastocatellia bacterium]|nr:DUF86 domain-containing protein [Blastocatellia bacterium]
MKDQRVYLAHILECIERIESYTLDGQAEFLSNRLIQDAVVRNFQMIGESVKRLTPEFRAACPGIPWRQMSAFRDVLVHDYLQVDSQQVWRVIEIELPMVKEAVSQLLPPLDVLEAELAGEGDA